MITEESFLKNSGGWEFLSFAKLRASVGVTGKFSLSLSDHTGVHLGFSRAVWVHNGPVDATDVTLGIHWYRAGKPRDR